MNRRSLLAATVHTAGAWAASSLAVQTAAATATATAKPPVVLGVIGISFHAVVGAVVQQVMSSLGQPTRVVNAAHDEMFRRLAEGEVDLLLTAWMPDTHRHLFDRISDRIERLATVYRDARLYLAVPAYVDAEVVGIGDLSRPAVASRMEKTVRSIGPSAGLSVRSARAFDSYGLTAAGYRLVPGATDAWIAGFKEAYAAQRWMVMPLWQPQFLNQTHALRVLADPQGVMGGADDAVIVASRAFMAKAGPEVLDVLRRIDIGNQAVTQMDVAVNVRGLSPDAAAAEWMASDAARVKRWTTAQSPVWAPRHASGPCSPPNASANTA